MYGKGETKNDTSSTLPHVHNGQSTILHISTCNVSDSVGIMPPFDDVE